MHLVTSTALIVMFQTAQSVPPFLLNRWHALSRRSSPSTCEFYGYADNKAVYNEYTIEMAGWGNEDSLSSCARGVPIIVQTQCDAQLDNFTCTQVHENLHDAKITFRINKAAAAQPDCVADALRLASPASHDEQTIECLCLAECWPSQMRL
ncbi:hypothetical protein GGR58DRAFT_494439 [Xylaria digitata]|nr:hypothetical protein GGR58DRAFT_494439 [Xylaria digitata]